MVKAILEKCAGLAVDERRTVRDDYIEVVAFTRDMAAWDRCIAEMLGPAAKPAGQKPQGRHETLAAAYGGIQAGQTLYCKEAEGGAEIVMVWPWRDGEHMTLKMARVEQQPAAAPAAAGSGRRGMPVAVWIAAGVVVVLAAFVAAFVVATRRLDARLRATVVQNVDPGQVADGTYEGVCDLGLVSARVRVTVHAGHIADINVIRHSHGPGYGAEKVAAAVVAAQTLDVDAVGGATGSSTVVRKAIENALRQGLRP